ncbi:hypothetical protein JL722_4032 [Aureococcus anophagefferens]|nr:hypothetical protein JL722_4032 [Aureococcus anophagefferens]
MATPTTLAELAPFWRADDNEGVSLESVSKEIAAYKPGGTFAEDYAAFVQLLQVVAHPKVGAVAIAKPGDKAEGDEGEEKAENSRVGVRNHVVDVGTAKCLSCAPPRGASHPGPPPDPPRAGVLPLHLTVTELVFYNCGMGLEAVELLAATVPRCLTLEKATVAVEYNPLPRAEAPAPDAEAPGDEAAPAPDPACVFARFLAENVPARAVSLRGDGLGDGGARAVADALARNTWVLTLNLFDNGIGDAGAPPSSAPRYNTMLKTLSLSNNACGDGTAAAAAATLAAHEAALGRLADLNKAIASGKKPKAKPGELRPPAGAGARYDERQRAGPRGAAQAPAERRGGAAARAARVGRRRGLRAGNKALEILNLSNNKISDAALAARGLRALRRPFAARAGGRARATQASPSTARLQARRRGPRGQPHAQRIDYDVGVELSASETRSSSEGGRR